MKFNDSPILDNHTYSLIENAYKNETTLDRKNFANKLFLLTSDCLKISYFIDKSVNPLIRKTLQDNVDVLLQIQENLKANFNINTNTNYQYKLTNIFELQIKLLECLSLTNTWVSIEEKSYYKIYLKNLINSLINTIKKINLSLQKSNIILFKHM